MSAAVRRRLDAHGLSCVVPAGWDVRITRRAESTVPVPASDLPMGGYVHPVLHAATSALPESRGDYGSGHVERMTARDVFVCLAEFDAEAGATAMFSDGLPRRLRSAEFHPDAQQRVIAGMCGSQRFVTESGRSFCLYVVLGSWPGRRSLVPLVNDFLAGVEVHPR